MKMSKINKVLSEVVTFLKSLVTILKLINEVKDLF